MVLILNNLSFSDREGIRTPNPQSRNLMRYSVAPRGHFFLYSVFSIQYSVFSIQYSVFKTKCYEASTKYL